MKCDTTDNLFLFIIVSNMLTIQSNLKFNVNKFYPFPYIILHDIIDDLIFIVSHVCFVAFLWVNFVLKNVCL